MECVNLALPGKRAFADVIKLTISIWGDYPARSEWVLNLVASVIREKQREITQTGEERVN